MDPITSIIDQVLRAESLIESVEPTLHELIRMAGSQSRFDSQAEFKKYLVEGTILNINTLASQNIGIPSGQYLVHTIDPAHTTLIPTESLMVQKTEFSSKPIEVGVFTQDLLHSWNKLEMLTEDGPMDTSPVPDNQDDMAKPSGKKEQIQTSDTRAKWPRDKQAKGAAEASGKTQQEIAAAASKIAGEPISEPDVSRALAAAGTPSSRMPELHRAAAIASAMGSTVEQVFGTKISKGSHR